MKLLYATSQLQNSVPTIQPLCPDVERTNRKLSRCLLLWSWPLVSAGCPTMSTSSTPTTTHRWMKVTGPIKGKNTSHPCCSILAFQFHLKLGLLKISIHAKYMLFYFQIMKSPHIRNIYLAFYWLAMVTFVFNNIGSLFWALACDCI